MRDLSAAFKLVGELAPRFRYFDGTIIAPESAMAEADALFTDFFDAPDSVQFGPIKVLNGFGDGTYEERSRIIKVDEALSVKVCKITDFDEESVTDFFIRLIDVPVLFMAETEHFSDVIACIRSTASNLDQDRIDDSLDTFRALHATLFPANGR